VKNIQGPGRTGAGGVASPGAHGIAPVRVRARPAVVPAKSRTAVETRSDRRDNFAENRASTIGSFFSRELRNDFSARRLTQFYPLPRFISIIILILARNIFGVIGKRFAWRPV
jgi:hypothetical protein